tara:strand:- start:737 stop:1240 length:504 start_codon:yes stop_codon:yes gene_type:complete
VILYLLDRSQIKQRVNRYNADIVSIENQLFEDDLIMEKIINARNDYETTIDTIKSYNLSGNQLMNEISRIRSLAKELNISVYKIEIDPQNTFPKYLHKNSTISIGLERQTLSFNLKGSFLEIGKFLENLEDIDSPLRIHSCSLSLDSLAPRGIIAQLRFATYTGLES